MKSPSSLKKSQKTRDSNSQRRGAFTQGVSASNHSLKLCSQYMGYRKQRGRGGSYYSECKFLIKN